MSKIDVGPLAGYNSLTDRHLAGYFNNTRMRKHLIKSGLITRQGEVVPESVYRLNTTRKDHRRNVRDLLAQAIVHKTLDMERSRQVAIRRKLEEIAKIELVRRVRMERHRKGDEDLIPLMSPRVRRPKRSPNRLRDGQDGGSVSDLSDHGPNVDPIYVDDDGMPVSPDAESRARLLKRFPNEEIDTKHLYALDSVALREYAKVLERYEKGRMSKSPYLMAQIPRPPTAAPASGRRPVTAGATSARPTKSASSKKQGSLVLHRPEPALMHQGRLQSLCEVEMRYFGQQVFTGREDVDPAQEVMVEQQHCGGNTLTVFKRRILPGTVFSFFSRRHRGFPFSLTFFINGVKDSRVSACCEYRHSKGARLGGRQGHFGIVRVSGAAPCYKCQVERGSVPADSGSKPRRSSKAKKAAPAQQDAAEYADDFEEDKEVAEEEEKKDEEKTEEAAERKSASSAGSSKASSKSSSAASSPRRPSDGEGSEHSSASGRRVEGEEAMVGKPLGFRDNEDEEEKEERRSGGSSPEAANKDGDRVSVDSDSDGAKSPLSKGSSLAEPDNVTVPVEEDEEKKDEEDKVEKLNDEAQKEEEPAAAKEAKVMTFSVFTGDELSAGTNAHVFCRVIGTEGTSDVVQLDSDDDGERHFERGSVDSFRVSVSGMEGKPKQLEIWHDGSGVGATWLLDKVQVVCDGEEFDFTWRNWLEGDTGSGDHHQFIDVAVAGPAKVTPTLMERGAAEEESTEGASTSEEEDEEEEKDLVAGAAAKDESTSPSSSSDEEEEEDEDKGKSAGGANSESGPDGGFDPDASRDPDSRPVLADSVDQAETFPSDGDVRVFVSPAIDNPDHRSVEVINTALNSAQLSRLAEVMDKHPTECLNIRNGEIDDDKLEILLNVLERSAELKMINLNCNRIGPRGAEMIAQRMSRWSKLELLLLHGNPLLDDGIDAIVSAIINRHQRSEGAGQTLGVLRSLDLGDSEMTNQGAYVVCRLLAENIPLQSLELTGNRKIGLDGWRQLGEALGTNKCLKTISVDYCGLRDDQLSCLIARLDANESLMSLDLEGNELSDQGGRKLRNLLVDNGTLCDVSLRPGNSDTSQELADEIAAMAMSNAED